MPALEPIHIRELQDSLGAYYLALNPGYKYVPYQQETMVPAMEDVEAGKENRLMILIAPGHSKSDLVTVNFTSWYMGRNPDKNVIVLSYSDDFAKDFGRKIRNRLQNPLHLDIFPRSQLSRDLYGAANFATISGGIFYAFGFEGAVFGKRADLCFTGDTIVETDAGPMDIRTVVQSLHRPRVLSYNHTTKKCEYQRILAVSENQSSDIVEVRTEGGSSLRCTGDHRIYTEESGYREAALLESGTRLVSCAVPKEQALPAVREAQGERQPRGNLLGLLQWATKSPRRSDLRLLRQRVREIVFGVREVFEAWAAETFLQPQVRFALPGERSAEPEAMPRLCERSPQEQGEVLFGRLRAADVGRQEAEEILRDMRRGVPDAKFAQWLLFAGLREQGSQQADDREEQPTFQRGNELCPVVQGDALAHPRAGWLALRSLQKLGWKVSERFFNRPSPRQKCEKQCWGEPDHLVPAVSHEAPQVSGDAVSVVRRLHVGRVPVYDIQVEGNSNFFANEILVHNCVIDDPLKSVKDARQHARERAEFTQSILKSRMKPGGRIVGCMTRLCINDYVQRLLEEEEKEKQDDIERDIKVADRPDPWHILKIPAETDGKYLWQSYLGRKHYEDAKKHAKSWMAMYQQEPERGGTGPWFVNIPFPTYQGVLKPGKFPAYMIVDPALSKHSKADRTSIMVLCATHEKKILLADWTLDRLDPDERTAEIIRLCKKWHIKRIVYEEYGLMIDTHYLGKALKDAGVSCRPIAVGRRGQRHSWAKEDRIEQLITEFKDLDKDNPGPHIQFPEKLEKRLIDGEKVDLIRFFKEEEYEVYAGADTTEHDEGLDCLSRIHDPEFTVRYPDAPGAEYAENKDKSIYSGTWAGTWESLMTLALMWWAS